MQKKSILSAIYGVKKNTFVSRFFAIGMIAVFLLVLAPKIAKADETMAHACSSSGIGGDLTPSVCQSAYTSCGGDAAANNPKDGGAAFSACFIADPGVSAARQTQSVGAAAVGAVAKYAFLLPVIDILNIILTIIQMIVSGLLGMAGLLLNKVIDLSIVNLASNITGLTGINITWTLIRDLCNMSFIFILVYNGIMTIFSGDNKAKKIIVPVIIAAILINFSLFFTKLIIDASNIVTISFYNSIMSGVSSVPVVANVSQGTFGMAGAIMNSLKLTSTYSANFLSALNPDAGYQLIWVNLGNAIFMLVATFVFLAMAVLFLIRYIAFIFLLILSPLGIFASFLPGFQSTSKKFWDTLLGQALFAPIFMIMIWIVLTLIAPGNGFLISGNTGASIATALAAPASSSIGIILNYFIVIGFLILAMITAKDYATKGGVVTSKLVDKATGYAGSAMFGSAAALGRGTIGARANTMANDEKLKDRAKTSWIAKQQLKASKFVAGSTFDTRRSGLGEAVQKQANINLGKGSLFNEKAGTGGYAQVIKDKEKKEEDFAKSLKPSDGATKAAQDLRDATYKDPEFSAREAAAKTTYLASEAYLKKKSTQDAMIAALEAKIAAAKTAEEKKSIADDLEKRKNEYAAELNSWISEEKRELIKNAGGQEEKKDKKGFIKEQKVESLGNERVAEYAKTLERKAARVEDRSALNPVKTLARLWYGNAQYNKAGAAKVRALNKAKSAKDKMAEAVTAQAKETKDAGGDEEETPKEAATPAPEPTPAPETPKAA